MENRLMSFTGNINCHENNAEISDRSWANGENERIINLTNASVNIENSKDVVIGNAFHHYHGPVTLHQIQVAPTVPEEIATTISRTKLGPEEPEISPDDTTSSSTSFFTKKRTLIILIVLSCTTILLIFILFFFFSGTNADDGSVTAKKPNEIDSDEKLPRTFGGSNLHQCKVIEEQEWGIKRNLEDIILNHPVPLVIISHSATPFCKNFDQCKARIAQIQEYHISQGSPDIGYNFIIGGDGNIYVGRGWNARNFHVGNHSIGLNFIGNYFRDELSPKMIDCAKAVLRYGVETGILSDSYMVVGHNQTAFRLGGTVSPGPNVYRIIKKWPHFFNRSLDRNFLYGVKGL